MIAIADTRSVWVDRDLRAPDLAWARANRERLRDERVLALNLMSSPGAGKTSLLVRTLEDLGSTPAAVVEGDQATVHDAQRIGATGRPVVQVNTGQVCHVEARMIGEALNHLPLPRDGFLFVENVGNLVCPAGFDLGEGRRVVLASVTEGEDKPLKYSPIFASADLVVLTKVDLLPHLDFDLARWRAFARQVAKPQAQLLELSAKTGEGMDRWMSWLEAERASL